MVEPAYVSGEGEEGVGYFRCADGPAQIKKLTKGVSLERRRTRRTPACRELNWPT